MSVVYAFSWQDLWQNPDLVAQKMMNQGQYVEAEKHFKREDWQAAAAFRAKNYDKAAALFSSLNQADGYYNAGNAYAKMGRYQEAIQAYNKALELNHQDKDARDNRRIVQELLKKQEQKKQDQDKQDQNKQDQNKQDQNKQDQNKQDQNKQGQDKQSQDKQGQDKQSQDKQDQDKQDQNKQGQDKQDQDKPEQNQQNQSSKDEGKKPSDKASKTDSAKEASERQNTEQLLNMIPDDPGGLLREKFLRDYLRRRGES